MVFQKNSQDVTKKDMTNKLGNKYQKRRSQKDLEEEILKTLRLVEDGICTTEIARHVKCGYYVALNRLRKMEFDGKVMTFRPGFKETKTYWRIKR